MQHRTVFIAFSFLVPLLLGGANVVFGQGIKGAVNVHCLRFFSLLPDRSQTFSLGFSSQSGSLLDNRHKWIHGTGDNFFAESVRVVS